MAGRLGDILVEHGWITSEQLDLALHSQGSEKGRLGALLVRRGQITLEQLGQALSQQFDVPYFEIVPQAVNPQIVRLLPESFARERNAVPVGVSRGRMTLAMVAPDDIETISET